MSNKIVDLPKIIQILREGKRREARQQLAQLIHSNPQYAEAWYVLSFLVDDPTHQLDCLRRTLKFAPDHSEARKRLQELAITPSLNHPEEKFKSKAQSLQKGTLKELTVSLVTESTDLVVNTPEEEKSKQQINPHTPITGTREAHSTEKKNTPTSLVNIPVISTDGEAHPKIGDVTGYFRRLWQVDDDRDREGSKQPDTLQLLFDDVARLPIIINLHQEFWLGVQLQATRRLEVILENWKSQVSRVAYDQFLLQSLYEDWTQLEQHCLTQELPCPRLEIWLNELLTARRNVYALHRSHAKRFLRRVGVMAESAVAQELSESVYRVVETLAVLPDEVLEQLPRSVRANLNLSPIDPIAMQLPTGPDVFEQQVNHRVKQTRRILTTGYLRYAMRIAQGYIGQGVAYTDLVQAGFMGLWRAAGKFDYRVQARFGTYATSWIWQAVGREIADQGQLIRLPVHIQEIWRKWVNACNRYDDGSTEPTHNPKILFQAGFLDNEDYAEIDQAIQSENSLSGELGKRYKTAIKKARQLCAYQVQHLPLEEVMVSLTGRDSLDNAMPLADWIPDVAPAPDKVVDERLASQIIQEQIFAFLDSREQEVLELRYGLRDGEERTLEQIGSLKGLTRERIRQIEAKALKKIENRITLNLLSDPHYLIPESQQHISLPVNFHMLFHDAISEQIENSQSQQLNSLLAQLPRSDWVQGRSGIQRGQRQEQLLAAFQTLAVPAHVADIAEQVNGMAADKELDESHIYALLLRDESTFILLGQGTFSLVAWERSRAKEDAPILPCCPMPLPDPPEFEDAFFESVLVGQQALAQQLTAGQFVRYMLNWAKADAEQPNWFLQTVLSAYYLVDLIPCVFYFGGENPVLTCTLPSGSIQDLRYHCLKTLTERLVAMPEFWWLLQQQQPTRPVDLSEIFADIHPFGLDDVLQRLRLLASLGAAQKLKYGMYRLTPLGEECANRWKKEAIMETAVESGINVSDFEDRFTDFIAW